MIIISINNDTYLLPEDEGYNIYKAKQEPKIIVTRLACNNQFSTTVSSEETAKLVCEAITKALMEGKKNISILCKDELIIESK